MRRLIIKTTIVVLIGLTVVPPWGGRVRAQDPVSEILRLVNQVRAEAGVGSLRINSTLAAAAQEFTEWRTQAGVITHTGPGGSTPRDRALAAGYNRTYVGENIVEGGLMTPEAAVRWWLGSPVHYRNMTSPNYEDVGIGYTITESGYKRYTLLMGGGGARRPSASSDGGGDQEEAPPQPVISPVLVATPRADGAVIHVVEPGQALWTIAVVYEVDLARLLELNDLWEGAYIHPGNEIIIDPGNMPPQPKAPLIHVVQPEDTLWTIAAIYRVDLEELMALNGLAEGDLIHPGNEIIVRPGPPTATPMPTETPPPTQTLVISPTAPRTPAPTDATADARVPTARMTLTTATTTPTLVVGGERAADNEPKGLVPKVALIIGMGLLGFAGLVALVGITLERRRR
jgi:LysM repeat protein